MADQLVGAACRIVVVLGDRPQRYPWFCSAVPGSERTRAADAPEWRTTKKQTTTGSSQYSPPTVDDGDVVDQRDPVRRRQGRRRFAGFEEKRMCFVGVLSAVP